MYTLIELCCGSAALALHLLGARRPLLPYQGSKWRYRKGLAAIVRKLGCLGPPRRVELYDPGPWGTTIRSVISPSERGGLIDRIRFMSRIDARRVYAALHGQIAPEDAIEFAAQHLYLQRLAYSGKAVGVRSGRWVSPGFNSSSAYGLAETVRFGEVLPMVPSLLRTLESYAAMVGPERLVCERSGARLAVEAYLDPTVVYIDPPYAGSTAYPGGTLERDGVVQLALSHANAGGFVIVSEAEPIIELTTQGWHSSQLSTGRQDTSRFRGKQQEWITVCPKVTPAIETL